MNQEVQTQWTDALRSGEYPQDQGFLRTPRGYCCLGVLCQLAVEAGVLPEPDLEDGGYRYKRAGVGSRYYLPREVMTWAELSSDNPAVVIYGDEAVETTKNLSLLNDEGSTFDEIADLIDEHL